MVVVSVRCVVKQSRVSGWAEDHELARRQISWHITKRNKYSQDKRADQRDVNFA